MIITLPQQSSIKCQVGEFNLLINPSSGKKGNLILKTKLETPINSFDNPDIVTGPGEYEIEGVRIRGIELKNRESSNTINTIFITELDGIKMAFLIDIEGELTEKELDRINNIDILFFSTKTLKEKQISSLIKQIDPKIIIPVSEESSNIIEKELGKKVEKEEKLVIKKSDLLKNETTNNLVCLKTK